MRRLRQLPFAAALLTLSCQDATAPRDASPVQGLAPNLSIAAGSGSWVTGTPMPLPKNNGATGVVNGQLYAAGAVNNLQTDLQVYDPTTGVWTLKTPTVGRARAMGAGISGKFYLAGGCIGSDCRIGTTNLLQAYDPATNAWTNKASMPTARHFSGNAVIGGKLYVVGGQRACAPCALQENLTAVLEVYDPATDTWASKKQMPGTRSFVAAAAVNGKLYVVGSNDTPGGFVASLDVYDPATDSWSVKTAPAPVGWYGVGELSGIIYLVSGYASPFSLAPSTEVQAYDAATDQWVAVAPIITGVVSARPQPIGGSLYVVATGPGGTISSLLQVYSPVSVPSLDLPSITPQVSAGFAHTCALKADGTVVCWGSSGYEGPSTVPSGLASVAQVTAGIGHMCALRTTGTVLCWGLNDQGQAIAPSGLASVAQLSTGPSYHTCALKTDRKLICWGYNVGGQTTVPPGLALVAQVTTGTGHTCALKMDATVSCWGENGNGQATVPGGLTSIAQVSGGGNYTCALKTDRTVICWGLNSSGETTIPGALGPVSQVSAGYAHACALRTNATVVCWGWNAHGQTSVPPELSSVAQVSAGFWHTCALKTDGGVVCWGDNDYAGQSAVPVGLNLYLAQAIAFTSSAPTPGFAGGTYAVAATGGASGNPVTFSSLTGSTCTVDGTTVSLVAAGSCTVAANQAGGSGYGAAPQQTQSFTIALSAQSITFTSTPPSQAFIGGNYTVSATGGLSGNAVSFGSGTPLVCSVSGSTVSFFAVGSCTVAANQGAANGYDAAPEVTQVFSIVKAPQKTLTVVAGTPVVFGTATDLSSTGGSGTGAVTFAIVAGSCSLSGATLTPTSGTGSCSVTATKAADANYDAATSIAATVSLEKASQLITFTQPASPATFGTTFSVSPTSSIGSSVSTVASGGCSISAGSVTMTSGTTACTLTASQSGDDNISAAAEVVRTVDAALATPPTLTVDAGSPLTYNSSETLTSTGGIGLVSYATSTNCSVSGATLKANSGTGSCQVTATIAGDNNYNAATSAALTVTLRKAPSSVTVICPAEPETFTGSSFSPCSASYSGVGGLSGALTLTYTDNTNVGTAGALASYGGDDNHLASTNSGSFTIVVAPQSLSFTSLPPSPARVGGSYAPAATGGASGNAVVFTASTPSVCTIASGAVSFVGTGSCTIAANQAGNGNYLAAGQQTQTFIITAAPDITPPLATINSAADGNGAVIATGTATLSNAAAFTFAGTDAVGIAGYRCSIDGAPYVACSSPRTYSALALGAHSFAVVAMDAAGNVSVPASMTWSVVTPTQAIQTLINTIGGMGLPNGVANSLTAPLNNINTNNLSAACGKLGAFVSQVDVKTQNGQLTMPAASQLLSAATAIRASLGCGG